LLCRGRVGDPAALFTIGCERLFKSNSLLPQGRKQGHVALGVTVSLPQNIDVTLQSGERPLVLREIGKLRSGSVIELDRHVRDPAELLLGDRIVGPGRGGSRRWELRIAVTEVL
jgi:flagellar motor switch protein FliN